MIDEEVSMVGAYLTESVLSLDEKLKGKLENIRGVDVGEGGVFEAKHVLP